MLNYDINILWINYKFTLSFFLSDHILNLGNNIRILILGGKLCMEKYRKFPRFLLIFQDFSLHTRIIWGYMKFSTFHRGNLWNFNSILPNQVNVIDVQDAFLHDSFSSLLFSSSSRNAILDRVLFAVEVYSHTSCHIIDHNWYIFLAFTKCHR